MAYDDEFLRYDEDDEEPKRPRFATPFVSPEIGGGDYPAPSPVTNPWVMQSAYPAVRSANDDPNEALNNSLGALKDYSDLAVKEPTHAQYPVKHLGKWATLGGALAAGAMEFGHPGEGAKGIDMVFGGPQRESDRQFKQAHEDWANKQNALGTRVKLGEEIAKTKKELNPPAEKPEKPDTMESAEGPLQFNRETKQWEHVTVGGKAVGPKAEKVDEKEKDIADYLAANKLEDTPTNREKARDAIAKRGPEANAGYGGNWQPLYSTDPKTPGLIVGSWNPKTGEVKHAPTNMLGTTAQGHGQAEKADAAKEKQTTPLKNVLAEVEDARSAKKLADSGNAEADVGLALTFFKVMRGASGPAGTGGGIRFTQQENNLIMGARSLWGAMEVKGNKIFANGQPLSTEQRQQLMDVIEMYGSAAQRRLHDIEGGEAQGGENEPQRPANVPAGYKFNAHGPKGAGWYR